MGIETALTRLLGVEHPIVLAGMAGGISTPELVAAVSEAGGLGTVGAGYMTPPQIRESIRAVRRLTDRPFAVNLFAPQDEAVDRAAVARMEERLGKYRAALGLGDEPVARPYAESFEAQVEVVLEERVPVFSFTFGELPQEVLRRLRSEGTVVIGTATTVREAEALEKGGVDAVVAQGSEAGGHRGTFAGPFERAMVGLFALVPQMADAVRIPVIAAGGVMDSRGVTAALALGAAGAQMGTAFLACPESGAHPLYKEALRSSADDSTVITQAFSGKPARAIQNAMAEDLGHPSSEIPEYPAQNALTREIRREAARAGRPEWMSLYAGQGSRLCAAEPAAKLLRRIAEGTVFPGG